MINVADPEFEADGPNGVSERQTGFSIPRGGIWDAGAGEQIAGAQRYEAVEAEKCRGGPGDGIVGPLPLGLDAQVGPGFGKSHLDLPSADVQGDDVLGFEGDVGTEEGLRIALCVGIADQYPSDRQHRGAWPVPQGDVGCDSSALALCDSCVDGPRWARRLAAV